MRAVLGLALYTVFALAQAEAKIIINSGSTLTFSGGELDMGCREILVRMGGTLQVNGGQIRESVLTLEDGAVYVLAGGEVSECSASFFIIKTADGKTITIEL